MNKNEIRGDDDSLSMDLDQFQEQTQMQRQRQVPKLRFPGFKDPWEQRKVSELAEKTYGGGTPTTSNKAYWNGDIPWIQSSDVVDGKLFGVEPRKHITQDGLNNSAAQLIPENSIAIITRVCVGKLAFMPYSYATSQDFLSLGKLNAEPLFTVYACYKKLQSELNAVQGTSIKGITKNELLSKSIMVPKYTEQKQIGDFFRQLDNLTTLHQRKLSILKQYKTGVLHKIFDGFDNERSILQHYKFNEIFKEYSKRNVENLEQYTIGKNGFKLISERTYNVSNHKVFNPGSLVLGIGIEEFAISENLSGCCSPVYTTYYIDTDKCSLEYLNQFLQFTMARNRNRICRKSTRREFEVTSEINDMDLYLPSMSKQMEISKILRVLDDIIYTYNNQLNQLKQLKTALLQQMLI